MTLIDYINDSPTSFHAVANSLQKLKESGYKEITEKEIWNLEWNQKYVLTRGDAALVAFYTGGESPTSGFHMAAAHTESPSLRIKTSSFKYQDNQLTATTDIYGGPIISSWLDRDLSVAGKITALMNGEILEGFINWAEPVGRVSNAPIHFNRNINKGKEYNPQTELLVSFGDATEEEFWNHIYQELSWSKEAKIIGTELYLYPSEKAQTIGVKADQIAAARLDNLAMCYSLTESMLNLKSASQISIIFLYDNEEVGSRTRRGADSAFTEQILRRIHNALKGSQEEYNVRIANSFNLSADAAHGSNPNYSQDFDPDYKPLLNKGPVIKVNTKQMYATTSYGFARYVQLCDQENVPYQQFIIRSDKPCGSTIGPAASSLTGIETVDIGLPLMSMHSIREVISKLDLEYFQKVLNSFLHK
ncbi:M18 family aminopeptidase [Spirochaeta cellobiosiphila]|uniref:M18 family aminopeptidase n=1 Tax=Spirochaeta cellobiosiphila TaxID=504483 RepID=UPI0004152E5D|nr:M18 family aminopeptidase [Spirochaeta cellobiosiphila]